MKTVRFKNPTYIGDPRNTVCIFNELLVDELMVLDIAASAKNAGPNYSLLGNIANECFMPLAYGGGIQNIEQAKRIFDMGYEKIVVNSSAFSNSSLISELATHYGSQAVIGSVDVKRDLLQRQTVRTKGGTFNTGKDPVSWAVDLELKGAGEILLTSIDREGTWNGFDLKLVRKISEAVSIPVIAQGGAGSEDHIYDAVKVGGASAVAVGSMVVFQKKGMGVLIHFPIKGIELEDNR